LASVLPCYSTPVGPASSAPAPSADVDYARSRSLMGVGEMTRPEVSGPA
jgi:hypothetical protein